MSPVFRFYYNSRQTTWNGSIKTFMNYTKDKQIHMMYALECAPFHIREEVRSKVQLWGTGENQESSDMMAFLRTGQNAKPPPEISIVSCLLSKIRGESCPICFEEMDNMEEMVVATSCRHVFCKSCIVRWATKSKTCPVCRGSTEKTLIHLGDRDMEKANEIYTQTASNSKEDIQTKSNDNNTMGLSERIMRELDIV